MTKNMNAEPQRLEEKLLEAGQGYDLDCDDVPWTVADFISLLQTFPQDAGLVVTNHSTEQSFQPSSLFGSKFKLKSSEKPFMHPLSDKVPGIGEQGGMVNTVVIGLMGFYEFNGLGWSRIKD